MSDTVVAVLLPTTRHILLDDFNDLDDGPNRRARIGHVASRARLPEVHSRRADDTTGPVRDPSAKGIADTFVSIALPHLTDGARFRFGVLGDITIIRGRYHRPIVPTARMSFHTSQ